MSPEILQQGAFSFVAGGLIF